MRPKRVLGRSGRAIAGAAGVSAVAVAAVVVVIVFGAVGLPGTGLAGATTSVAVVSPSPLPSIGSFSSAGWSAGSSSSPSSPASSDRPASTLAADPTPSSSPSASPAPAPSAVPATKLQGLLDRLRTKASIPGVSVAILWDDGRSWLGASGLRDLAGGLPMTAETGFSLASISKTFTAAVALELVGERQLSLDQSVARLLPSFRLDHRITLRMLLDHTSGLPDFFFGPGIDAALQGAPDAFWAPLVTWRYLPGTHLVPGAHWRYSNTNYMLLGEIVQVVTGHTLAQEIRTRLLDPLGLKTLWFQADEAPRATLSVGYRLAPVRGGGARAIAVAPASDVMPFRSVVTAAGGAGSMASTALDTARWMQAYVGGRVLSPAMQRAMLNDMLRTVLRRAAVPYGLGIQEVILAGHPAIGHAGRFLGYRSVVRYLPDLGITVAVLTNQGDYDPAKIAAALVGAVTPQPLAPRAVPPVPSPSRSPGASPVPSPSGSPAAPGASEGASSMP